MEQDENVIIVKEDSRVSLPLGTLIFSVASIIGLAVAGVSKYNNLEKAINNNTVLISTELLERKNENIIIKNDIIVVSAKIEKNETGILEIQKGISDIQTNVAVIIERLDWVRQENNK